MTNLDHIIPDLRTLAVPLDDLKLDPANARTGHALDKIAASLHRYGQRKPLVVNRSEGNKIEAGNGTWQAAKSLGWSHIAAVFVEDDPMTAVGYGIADNRLGDLSEWDADTLLKLVDGLDPDLNLPTGFDDGELADMLAELGAGLGDGGGGEPADAEPQVSRAEELRQVWGVEPGQLWRLPSRTPGQEHRLICGDCTDTAVVERVMGGEKADMVFTSPPYNRGTTTGGGFNTGGLSQQLTNSYNDYTDNRTVKEYRDWQSSLLLSWWDMLASSGAIFYNHRPRVQNGIYETPLCWNPDLPIRQIVIWHSGAGINFSPTHYRVAHEWIVIYAKPDFRLLSKGDSGIGDVWQFGAARVDGHPAPFTVDLPANALKTTICQIVYEPFSGSGTTIIAAENLARQCRAVEISPGYVGVALQRYADAFGITPELVTEETAVS